jgi:hypothetical protein
MTIQQGQCTVFKKNCLSGTENFAAGTSYVYKIALYTANANLSYATTTYTTTGEVTGTGYTAGGKVLTPIVPASSDQTAYVSFANVTWNPASFTTRGALIYNSTTNAAVAVLDFGADKTPTNSFTVTFPAATSTTAIIRFT